MRDALIWLDEADPCATMEEVRGADPKLEALIMVIEQWHTVLGGARVSVKGVIDAAVERRTCDPLGKPEFVNPEFREALLAVAGEGGAISGRRLGKWIAAHQNRIVGGMKLVSAGIVAGLARWRLVDSDGNAAHPPATTEVSDNVQAVTAFSL